MAFGEGRVLLQLVVLCLALAVPAAAVQHSNQVSAGSKGVLSKDPVGDVLKTLRGPDTVAPRIDQLVPAPGAWIVDSQGLVEVQVRFDEPVTVPAEAVTMWTVEAGDRVGVSTAYNAINDVLTISLGVAVYNDVATLVLDYTIIDGAGNALDGEISDPLNAQLPSGNGVAAGQAVFQFRVLQGDADRNGIVDTADAAIILDALGTCGGDAQYSAAADLNNDGCINALDVGLFTLNEGATLPQADGIPPAVVSVITADADTVAVTFNEAIAPTRFSTQSCYLIDGMGMPLVPDSALLAMDGLSATYDFAVPLITCEPYVVQLSNALADSSGELLAIPAAAPVLGALPSAVVLDPHDTMTNANTIVITGGTDVGAMVEVTGPAGTFEVAAPAGTFSADVPLLPNRLNHVFFTTISPCDGARSAPTSVGVTQDSQPPDLFIDFPAAGDDITTLTTDVAGRISDMLSGFMGLTVTVNGVMADVNVGIGTNGTFVATVPLTPDSDTVLEVVATDQLGNAATEQITVTQIAVPPNVPQITVISGNGQTGEVTTLLTEPLIVTLSQADGSPFVDKIVTFDVTRSNGRLTADPPVDPDEGALMLQVRTDASGEARAYWRLGSDAGMGNNRVAVTSTSVVGSTFFCASATPGPAAQINVGSGNDQRAEVGGAASEPLRVWVNDSCNGIGGVPVTFRVVQGGGAANGLNEVTVVTGGTGHAEVDFMLGLDPGNNIIEADFPGNSGLPARFTLVGLIRDEDAPTTFSGIVLDNGRRPVQGATVTLEVVGQLQPTVTTGLDGRFFFEDVSTSGTAHLGVDGLPAFHVGGVEGMDIPVGSFPALAYETVVVPNADNSLPVPVLLPPLNPVNARMFDNTMDVELTVEGIDGLRMIVKADSMTRADGTVPSMADPAIIALNPVHFDEIPMPMPDGATPPFAWTLQPAGAHFDPPVEIQLPNAVGLPPGAVTYFLSFNHDTNRFEIVATGAVTDNGECMVTDQNSGISVAGWGGFCPPYPNTGGVDGNGNPLPPGLEGPNEEPPSKHNPPGWPSAGGDPCDALGTGGIDPVYLFSGEFYEEVEDLRIAGRGLDFIWARKYRSKDGVPSAQGNGWDCSYNIFIEADGGDLLVCDGNSRRDRYVMQPDGRWARQGFFREVVQNPDGTYTMTFADRGTWTFAELDGSSDAGKIISSADRNANDLTFAYDGTGRLTTVTDTLDRDIEVAYNGDGFIESVTDFIGRQVRYEYYQDSDIGGSFGDLKSVTTPVVTGTPNGNDFPKGKTTVYTYSEGLADEALNHNLLTITDPKKQTYLVNEYAASLDPQALTYDRIVRQTWGDAGDVIDVTYAALQPSMDNGNAVIQVILNDRVGNIKEYFYDNRNLGVVEREYTGRADPDQPTTDTLNRPTGKLRPADPDYFETRYEWNADWLLARVIHPNGNITRNIYELDLDPQAPPRTRANLRSVIRLPGAHLPAGDQDTLVDVYEYEDNFNSGCCGFNFVTKHIDARGNITTHEYDDAGNLTHTQNRIPTVVEDREYNKFGQMTARVWPDNGSAHRRRDEYTYYDSGAQRGYLESDIVDSTGFALATTYEYDAVGNVTREIDPRGHDSLYVINALDQEVRSISREVTDGSGVRYERDTFHDANDNVVRMDVQNVDDQGVVQPNTHFTTTYEHETLNSVIRETMEVDGAENVIVEYAHDANRNVTLKRDGAATSGAQPTNVVQTLYDERDLIFQEIEASGDGDQSTTQSDYDGNKNQVVERQGLENVPRVTTYVYDGYDRRVEQIDAQGNVRSYSYDANDNRTGIRIEGELVDVAGSGGNVRLSEAVYVYDELDRRIRTEIEHFDAATQAAILDGKATTQAFYSDSSQIIRTVNDNDHETLVTYDTANRENVITDAVGNTTTYTYDNNSNILTVTEVEKSEIGGPDESFTTTFAYDNLNRKILDVDNIGNSTTHGHDSRHNRTLMIDALNHETRYVFDGLDRLTATIRDLDEDGADGDGADITTFQAWDDTSRLIGQTDDQGNVLTYQYDALNRVTRETYADGSEHSYTYDVHDNRLTQADANATVTTSTFDLLDRLIGKTISPGAGVSSATTFESYQFDGLSRIVRAEDNDTVVVRAYDSLLQLTVETLNGQTTTSMYDGAGNLVSCTYPGGRTITTTYDALERKAVVSDGQGLVASYAYVGPDRVARREYGNGTRTDYTYDGITGTPNPAGDFGVRKVIGMTHSVIAGGALIDQRTFTWDPLYNKSKRSDLRPGGPQLTHDYSYDATYRLTGATVTDATKVIVQDTSYGLDGVGNRGTVTGGPNPGSYVLDPTLPNPADAQLNQYTATPVDERLYDANGNLVTRNAPGGAPNQAQIQYDYRNQMVEYDDVVTGQRHVYAYDAFGRRVSRVVDADGTPETTRYFYNGWNACEEQDGAGATLATYTNGLYIDEVLNMRRGGTDYYYHGDDLHNVMAVTDDTASTVERYEYGDFGEAAFFDGAGGALSESVIDNPFLFTGRRLDTETAWYYLRTRYLDPVAGRFTTRDIVGMWEDGRNVGNGYTYVGNNPWTRVDPLGLGAWDWVQTGLDVVGMVPVVGVVADVANAGISVARGNYADAALSLAAAVPGAGQAVTAAKLARRGAKLARSGDALKLTRNVAKGVGGKKPVIIGENMKDRVIPKGKEIGADWYKPRKGGDAMEKNRRWIKDKMREGREFIDNGPDPNRATRSDFYKMELDELRKKGYPVGPSELLLGPRYGSLPARGLKYLPENQGQGGGVDPCD